MRALLSAVRAELTADSLVRKGAVFIITSKKTACME